MSVKTWEDSDVKRIQYPFLGLDIVQLHGNAIIHALNNGDLVRVEEAVEYDNLQWLFKLFLGITRFGSFNHGRFMPMRAWQDPEYHASRNELDKKFAEGAYPKLEEHIARIARKLVDPTNLPPKKELANDFIHAMADRFGLPVPDHVLNDAHKQILQIPDMFIPWKSIPGVPATERCHKWMKQNIENNGNPPGAGVGEGVVTDFSHSIFTPAFVGGDVLTAIAENPHRPAEQYFIETAIVKQLIRMSTRDTTLGGLLPEDNPAKSRFTAVVLNIADLCKQSPDTRFAFSSGGDFRRCAAAAEIMRIYDGVRLQVINLRANL